MKKPGSGGRLFRKYVVVLLVLVGGVLMASTLVEHYFSYWETQRAILRVERAKAVAAAAGIEQFLKEVEQQVRETTRTASDDPDASQVGQGRLGFRQGLGAALAEQRELDFLRVLRNVPAVSQLSHLDLAGKEQLRVSRLEPDVVGSQEDFSQAPKFLEARAGKTFWSPVYFKNESEPYVTLAVPLGKYALEVTTAEISLGAVLKAVSQIEVGPAGYAYVVDSRNQLVAHPDSRLLREKRDVSALVQVRSARAERSGPAADAPVAVVADGLGGGRVLAAHAVIAPLGWLVFVERPAADAYAPLRAPIIRSVVIFVLGVGLSILASLVLARRMVAPIRVLQEGAARIGAGTLDQPIELHTGDEIEALAGTFNRMTASLKESYEGLEQKVEARTQELADANRGLTEALEQQTATSEILRVISSSPTDVRPVFDTIVQNARRLCGADSAAVLMYDGELIQIESLDNASPERAGALRQAYPMPANRGHATGRAILTGRPVHIPDVREDPDYALAAVRGAGISSVLSVPLVRDGIPIGTITVHRWVTPRPFSDKQIELLQTFADQAVIAIENVRLFKELQERTQELTRSVEELRALGEVGQAVSSSLDIQSVLTSIVSHAVELSHTDAGTIYEFDEAAQVFEPRANFGISEELIEALRQSHIRLGESVVGQAAAARAAVQIPDLENEPDYPLPFLLKAGYRALLAVPLLREDRVIGALVVRRKAAGTFPKRIVDLLQTFATQSVIAIQNARLFREIDEKSRALEELSRNQEQLYRLSTALQEPLSLAEQLARVLDAARQVVGLDRIYTWTLNPKADGLMVTAQAGFEERDWQDLAGVTIPIGEAGALAAVCREGVPLLFTGENPLPVEYRLRPPYSALAGMRVKSFLIIPMIARGRTVGVLAADNRASRAPIPAHTVDLLQTFAAQAAVAVENARLFQEIQEKSLQLELASKHKSQFLANMSHELRTPMNAVLGYTDLILDDIFGEVPAPIRETLERVKTNGQHLLGLINDVLDLSRIEAGQLTLSLGDYAMGEVVHAVVSAVESLAAGKKLALRAIVPADLPPGRGDERRLTQVLLNLAGNAIKFTDTGEVSIEARAVGGALLVSVSDTGPGISEADQQKIFEEFQQADSSSTRKKGGSGLGLSISRRIVELHGGRLWVESAPGEGSTFHFTVPLKVERQAERA
ncbi:MAG: GAF domain-containing protein [Candidatus Rokubacteria bacterium]|nr:GAF domain-containing protein [Candidatus Rokubacteria bacterium]